MVPEGKMFFFLPFLLLDCLLCVCVFFPPPCFPSISLQEGSSVISAFRNTVLLLCMCVFVGFYCCFKDFLLCFLSHLSSFSSQYASLPPFPLSCLPPEVVYHVSMCYSSPSLWCHLIKIICLVFTPPSEHEYISLRLSVKVCVVWQMKLHSSSCSVQSGVTCSGPLALLHCLWRSVYAVFLCLNTPPWCLLNC